VSARSRDRNNKKRRGWLLVSQVDNIANRDPIARGYHSRISSGEIKINMHVRYHLKLDEVKAVLERKHKPET
jgi:hypothetical protein